jgi:2'-hydroxyisoflavone reductase
MRVLIIGGTRFIGRHIAQAALDRQHDVTLFNRGRTAPNLFAEAEHVRGDRRQGGLQALASRTFDLVIDTSAYFPADVRALEILAPTTGHYTFMSSLSVYREPVAAGTDESGPVWELAGPVPEEIADAETYGALKAECEDEADSVFPERAFKVRAGFVAGPHDYSDRVFDWLRRIFDRHVVLAGRPDQPLQLIDARDLADWVITAAEGSVTGTFNTTGPERPLSHGIEPAEELPFWLPRTLEDFCRFDCSKAVRHGLAFRPLEETISDTWGWVQERTAEARQRLAPSREATLIEELRR